MSSISVNQFPVQATPTAIQRWRIHPRTGRVNMLFVDEGERKNDGTYKTGVALSFALLESDTGDADDWTLVSKTGNAGTNTTISSASNASGVLLSGITGLTYPAVGGYVALSGANVDSANGIYKVATTGNGTTTLVIDSTWDASTSGLSTGILATINPITLNPGGSQTSNFLSQKKLMQVWGWGTSSGGGYCRVDLQFSGLFNHGQIDIEVGATKQGFGFDGNGAAGVSGLSRDTAWPETP